MTRPRPGRVLQSARRVINGRVRLGKASDICEGSYHFGSVINEASGVCSVFTKWTPRSLSSFRPQEDADPITASGSGGRVAFNAVGCCSCLSAAMSATKSVVWARSDLPLSVNVTRLRGASGDAVCAGRASSADWIQMAVRGDRVIPCSRSASRLSRDSKLATPMRRPCVVSVAGLQA